MSHDKPLELDESERALHQAMPVGSFYERPRHEQPVHDIKRKVYKLKCAVCGYPAHRRLYVCPKCGNCQACGGLNIIGEVHQSCQQCGNGSQVKPFAVPEYVQAGQVHHESSPPTDQLDVERKAHSKKQAAKGVNVTNPHN